MNIDELQRKLLAAGRASPPGDSVPYAFEKRILARLTSRPVADAWMVWNRVLWRAAAPCVALTILLVAWTFVAVPSSANTHDPLADELAGALLAPLENAGDVW